jgi:alpha-amylase
MNWDDIKSNPEKNIVALAKIRSIQKNHPSVGAGIHQQISLNRILFRTFKGNYIDKVVVALDLKIGAKEISVGTIFANGTLLTDAYSGKEVLVANVESDNRF